MMPTTPNERIAPTAWATAYRRTFSDISYAKEIFDQVERIMSENGEPEMPIEFKMPALATQIEARYKLIDKLLTESKVTQALEVAAGLSPRGLIASEGQKIEYVELDLPSIIALKKEILGRIKGSMLPPRLHLVEGNAFDLSSLERATAYFDPHKPIAIINEGLLHYFSMGEKAKYASNVSALLKRFGGVWITTDITLKRTVAASEATMNYLNTIKGVTGINFDDNLFDDVHAAETFFNKLGFTVEVHDFMELKDQLVSPARLNIPKEELDKPVARSVFVMRLSAQRY